MRLATLLLVAAVAAPVAAQSPAAVQTPDGARTFSERGRHHVVYGPAGGPTVESLAAARRASGTATVAVFSAGQGVEADNLAEVAYSSDGALVVATHAYTDNLTILDAATRTVLATVPVGAFPLGVAASAEVAVVANVLSRTVSIVDLAARTVRATVAMPGAPVRVVLSPDGQTAFVAIENPFFGAPGTCQILDLATRTIVGELTGFPVELFGQTFLDNVDRVSYVHNPYVVTPDGRRIVTGSSELPFRLFVFDVPSRSLVLSVPVPAYALGLDLSADGTVAVFANLQGLSSRGVGRVDLTTGTLTDFVEIPTAPFAIPTGVVTTADASRAVVVRRAGDVAEAVAVSFGGPAPRVLGAVPASALVRTPDRRYALVSGDGWAVLDLTTEAVVWSEASTSFAPYSAASPAGGQFATGSLFEREGVAFVGVRAGTASLDGYPETGELAEGDGPTRARARPGTSTVVVSNYVSGNVSVVDPVAAAVVAVLPALPRASDLAVTADGSHVAVVGQGGARLIALPSGGVVASASLPEQVVAVAPTRDGSVLAVSGYGYVAAPGEFVFPRVVVLRRAGSTYETVATHAGFADDLAATPDGRVVIAPTDDGKGSLATLFIDGQTGALLRRTLVGVDVAGVAVSSDGRYAALLDAATGRVSTFETGNAAVPLVQSFPTSFSARDLAFVPGTADVWVAGPTALGRYSAVTGALLDSQPVPAPARRVRVAPNGAPVAYLEPGSGPPSLWARGVVTPLPATLLFPGNSSPLVLMRPKDFVLVPETNALLFVGNRDELVAVRDLGVAAEADPADAAVSVSVTPNPAAGLVRAVVVLPEAVADARVDVLDVAGRQVQTLHDGPLAAGRTETEWDSRDAAGQPAAAGVYLVRVRAAGRIRTVRVVVVR